MIKAVLTRSKQPRLGITTGKKYPVKRIEGRLRHEKILIETDDGRHIFVTPGIPGAVMGEFKEVL